MGKAEVDDHALDLRQTDAELQVAGEALGDADVDVEQVLAVGHPLEREVDAADVVQALQAHARPVDLGALVQLALELPHLAPQDDVAGLVVTRKVDVAHAHPVSRVDEKLQRDRLVGLVDLVANANFGVGVTVLA